MGRAIGIDLGTTNSCMAFLEAGNPTVIANSEGDRVTPSVVAFSPDGETLVGSVAQRQAVTNASRTFASVKRHIGTDWTCDVDGKTYRPQEISARVLQKLKRDAEEYLNEEVTDAVITVPAYFDDAQRQATVEAGQVAGLNVMRIINEPTAAAVAYGLGRGKDDEKILVFDLGGGTFDVSVLQVAKADDFSSIQVLATSGDNALGGDDWDQKIVDWLVEKINATAGTTVELDAAAGQRLKEAAEQAKKELSSAVSTTISLQYVAVTPAGPLHLEEKLSRGQFEDMTEDLLDRTKVPFQNALNDAGVTADELDHVVLVGGSTRMPAVAELVTELTGKEPNKGVNPDEVVAAGAAIQTGVLSGKRRDLLLIDVTPLSLGVETRGGIIKHLIERNTAIPTEHSEVFTTAEDGQDSVEVCVYQGERHMAADNKLLGTVVLDNLPPAARGVPQIEVKFSIDVDGLVNVSAKDLATGAERSVTLSGGSSLSDAEVKRMIADAQEHEEADRTRREQAAARTQAEDLAYRTERQLSKHADNLPADVTDQVGADLQSLKDALATGTPEQVTSAVETLQKSHTRIGDAIYQKQ